MARANRWNTVACKLQDCKFVGNLLGSNHELSKFGKALVGKLVAVETEANQVSESLVEDKSLTQVRGLLIVEVAMDKLELPYQGVVVLDHLAYSCQVELKMLHIEHFSM